MSLLEKFGAEADKAWQTFITKEHLTELQAQQFEQYLMMLRDWNEIMNITRIVDVPDIVAYHFQDSMRVADFCDLKSAKAICDVGSGGGFPGIPLKILFPKMPLFLIEVNQKKASFLQAVIDELGLENCTISSLDWRTFLRQTSYDIDWFFSRASLKPDELVRVFKPGSPYNNAHMVYWASQHWQPGPAESPFVCKRETYVVGDQQRTFVFFNNKKAL